MFKTEHGKRRITLHRRALQQEWNLRQKVGFQCLVCYHLGLKWKILTSTYYIERHYTT